MYRAAARQAIQKFQFSLSELILNLYSTTVLKVEVHNLSRNQTKGKQNNDVDATQCAADETVAAVG